MTIHYLEIVSTDVDREIAILESAQGLSFGAPVAALGGARIAEKSSGGSIGVRAPMHDQEAAATRPYFLTETLEDTLAELVERGAEVAVPPMPIKGHGMIAVYFVGDLQYGLWQL